MLRAEDWDPRDQSFRHDPTPWYRALREQSPVHRHPEVGIVSSGHAALGRLEGQIAIPAALDRFADLALVEPVPTWRSSFVTRPLDRLPLTAAAQHPRR